MLEERLVNALRRAIVLAEKRGQKHATLEHLLLALLDHRDARTVLIDCGADLADLRSKLLEFIDHGGAPIAAEGEHVAQPNGGFQRAIQHTSIAVQCAGREWITAADLLAELLDETDAYAVHLLNEQGIARPDISRQLGVLRP